MLCFPRCPQCLNEYTHETLLLRLVLSVCALIDCRFLLACYRDVLLIRHYLFLWNYLLIIKLLLEPFNKFLLNHWSVFHQRPPPISFKGWGRWKTSATLVPLRTFSRVIINVFQSMFSCFKWPLRRCSKNRLSKLARRQWTFCLWISK